MTWTIYEGSANTPELLSSAEITPGLFLNRIRIEVLSESSFFHKISWVELNGNKFEGGDSQLLYTEILQTLKSGGFVSYLMKMSSYYELYPHQGDVYRHFLKNTTQNDMELAIKWVNDLDDTLLWRDNWVELGRFYWEDGECYRETLFKYVWGYDQKDPEVKKFEGNIVIPPGEWDLNMSLAGMTNWPWQGCFTRSSLWLPQHGPNPLIPSSRRRRAAWAAMERPLTL